MKGISFSVLNKEIFDNVSADLFEILHSNMSVIAPLGESYEDDKKMWISSITDALQNPQRNIILITHLSEIIGFFMYSISNDLLKMEEIQFKADYHGKGIFNELYFYAFTLIPDNVKFVEAFANKPNLKSQGILTHLKLKITGENHNGNCWRFYGLYDDLKNTIKENNTEVNYEI